MSDETKLGATGKFPQGKLTPDDKGALVMRVGHTDPPKARVVVEFGKAVPWIAMTADEAITMALSLIEHARAIGGARQ